MLDAVPIGLGAWVVHQDFGYSESSDFVASAKTRSVALGEGVVVVGSGEELRISIPSGPNFLEAKLHSSDHVPGNGEEVYLHAPCEHPQWPKAHLPHPQILPGL